MIESPSIPKNPVLDPSEDYAWLRAKGLAYIQQLGSRLWTDYNIHDPGITLLELLCYALTDLGYRTGYRVADLLAAPPGKVTDFKRQGFHTAREILSMNPLTVRDFRKLLIDIDGVKNGWLQVVGGACEGVQAYADCAKSLLQWFPSTDHPLSIKGLYDVLVEFEDVERMGNLNSGKVFYPFAFNPGTPNASTALIELRLPSWQALEQSPAKYKDFRRAASALITPGAPQKPVEVLFISGNKGDNQDVQPADQDAALRGVVFATLKVRFLRDAANPASLETLDFADVPMRVWFKGDSFRKSLKLADLKKAMEDASAAGLVGRYHELVLKADQVMKTARQALQARRNLAEDWCGIKAVAVEDVAVCADMELDPAADIEAVMAEAFYRIDQYMSPDIRFLSLKELLDRGVPVEEIFEGPELDNGFIDNAQVDATNLRTVLYTSDILNLLMDIPGVKSIRNFTLARYDQEGRQAGPAEKWELAVTAQHQARFYPQASKFLIFKNGLPFLPDISELNDVLQVIKGRNAQPKFPDTEKDLPIPVGTYYPLQDYHPVQYQLPLTYGVGYEGLPADAPAERVAQARQLKAYLLFFEQRLVDYLAQLSHLSEIFAIDAAVDKTYFSRFIDNALLKGVKDEIYPDFDAAKLQALSESPAEWLDRRNRFLDHLLSRFAESFADYALMLYRNAPDKSAAKQQLIGRKIAFLKDIPRLTHDRAKAFDYTAPAAICNPGPPGSLNAAGLGVRIKRLLGLEVPDDKIFVVEHLLFRPRRQDLDPLLPICIPPGCEACGEEDPYSFRITLVIGGEGGVANSEIEWRRFAEKAVRMEVPAHLAAKICWVSKAQLTAFEAVWCPWLAELAKDPLDKAALAARLEDLLTVFNALKSVYPPASLHDCADGNDENRVFLDQSIITSSPAEEE
jgi:hypothetical protein